MALTRVYVDQTLESGKTISLPESCVHHVARVLRMRTSDPLILFNGEGGEYAAKIIYLNRKDVRVEINNHRAIERESSLKIDLIQSISKGEKMDFTLQKAVELGVASIAPVISQFTNVRLDEKRIEKKHQHWQGIIRSACEQSGRNQIPGLHPIASLKECSGMTQEGLKLVLDPEADQSLGSLTLESNHITILIGPEGGFNRSEDRMLAQAGFVGMQMGERILRTETAALAAIATLQGCYGDFR